MKMRFVASYGFVAVCMIAVGGCKKTNSFKGGAPIAQAADADPKEPLKSKTETVDISAKSKGSILLKVGPQTLTCLPPVKGGEDTECTVTNARGLEENVDFTRAFKISGKNRNWLEVKFRKGSGTGKYLVSVPSGETSHFAVALVFDTDKVLADWLFVKGDQQDNILKDGGFEDIKISSDYELIPPERAGYWKAKATAINRCPDEVGLLEIQSNLIGFNSQEGSQWLEVDSGCKGALSVQKSGGAVAVSQDLTLPAKNLVELSFYYEKRPDAQSLQKLRAKFGDAVVMEQVLINPTWTNFKMVVRVDKAQSKVEFEELGLSDALGPLIDNVSVVDLGAGIIEE
jgi:hypothetical protein